MSVKIVVIGANGLLGRAFANQLSELTQFHVESDRQLPIRNVTLIDIDIQYYQEHPIISKLSHFTVIKGNFSDTDFIKNQIEPAARDQQVIVYLFAALLSGYAESNFELGLKINLQAPLSFLNVMKGCGERLGRPLTLIYTSSDYVACFNEENRTRPFSEEGFRLSPASYGVQKACMELLICDFARRGYVDGRVGRISAMIGRPGFSNSISSAFSMIFTQTLLGNDYKVPLPMDSILPCSSLENNVDCLLQLGGKIDGNVLGHNRVVQLPAATYNLNEIWRATQEAATRQGIRLGSIIQIDPNESSTTFTQLNVVPVVDCSRAKLLGLPQDIGLKSIIDNFIVREKLNTPHK